MFIGSLNAEVRQFLGNVAPVFHGKVVIVGCSGNFTSEALITQYARPQAIHSNDVSLYSTLAADVLLLRDSSTITHIAEPAYQWLQDYWQTPMDRLAAVMVLLDMLPFERQKNLHQQRMWRNYRQAFGGLVEATIHRVQAVDIRIDSYFAGDVFEHFERFGNTPDAVFACYAPTYKNGYERLYKRLHQIIAWQSPQYAILDDERRDALLHWMSQRDYLWYDDRPIAGHTPVLVQQSGRNRTVYLYSNIIPTTAFMADIPRDPLPSLPLASADWQIPADGAVQFVLLTTTILARFKDAFLGKNILHGAGLWAFAVLVDGVVIGFLEYAKSKYGGPESLYLMADFAIPGTRYARLSKLIVQLAICRDLRQRLERLAEYRLKDLDTTAFTEKPVSMKYRGVFELVKRGTTPDGQAFLNYHGVFTQQSAQEVLQGWMTRHGSTHSSARSMTPSAA